MLNCPVFLIGFMGAGKSKLGKALAKKLDTPFIDSDDEIANSFKMSIHTFFKTHGEERFRQEESKWLNKLSRKPSIIATGGGMPCFNNNIQFMNEVGCTVYLKRPEKELLSRLKNAKTRRPLIAEMDNNQLLLFIENELNKRSYYYEQASVVLNRNQQTVDEIKKLLISIPPSK